MTVLDVKVAAARAAGSLSRRAGRGGTSLPGKVLMRLDPHAIANTSAESTPPERPRITSSGPTMSRMRAVDSAT